MVDLKILDPLLNLPQACGYISAQPLLRIWFQQAEEIAGLGVVVTVVVTMIPARYG